MFTPCLSIMGRIVGQFRGTLTKATHATVLFMEKYDSSVIELVTLFLKYSK